MAHTESNKVEEEKRRRTIFIVVGALSALLVAGLIYVVTRPTTNVSGPPRLEGALRSGTPEFEQLRERIVLDELDAFESTRPLGDIVMDLRGTVRNFTGRTINGLELRGAVVDTEGSPVKERTVIIIPTARLSELEPNRIMQARVILEQISKTAVRADTKMEITAIRFK